MVKLPSTERPVKHIHVSLNVLRKVIKDYDHSQGCPGPSSLARQSYRYWTLNFPKPLISGHMQSKSFWGRIFFFALKIEKVPH